MSKNIADLYNEVMSQAATEKTASEAGGVVFDRSFFEKVASGDEDSVGALNAFIDEARSEGYNDEQIESAIDEAMNEAGVDDGSDGSDVSDDFSEDEFEMAKSAAYAEGVEEAFAHVMESDLVKTAGLTEQDLMEYQLGLAKGQGYAETRAALESVVEKIAEGKMDALKAMAGKAKDSVMNAGSRGKALLTGSNVRANVREMAGEGATLGKKIKTYGDIIRGNAGNAMMTGEARKSLGAQGLAAGALAGGAYGAKKMYDRKKKR
jgi:hypothetical protein